MKQLALLLTGLTLSASIQAAGLDIKPGLWEIKSQTSMNGQQMPDMQKQMAEMQKQMANMPPEMQARMKSAMSQGGHMGMTDQGITVCMTQEQIDRSEIQQDPNNHCKTLDIKRSGNKTTMKMHCSAPRQADITTVITRISDTEWQSNTHITSDKRSVDSSGHGKWLKADCGDIKPLSTLKKK